MLEPEELAFRTTQVLYQPLFNKDESENILKLSESLEYEDALVGNKKYNQQYNFANTFNIEKKQNRITKTAELKINKENLWIIDRVRDCVINANHKFFKFDNIFFPSFDILEYEAGGKFDWHMDSGIDYPYTHRKISVIVFLSERSDYEGGDLEFLPALKENIKMEQGHIIMFSSHKLHRVTPIIKGIRKTMVSWGYMR